MRIILQTNKPNLRGEVGREPQPDDCKELLTYCKQGRHKLRIASEIYKDQRHNVAHVAVWSPKENHYYGWVDLMRLLRPSYPLDFSDDKKLHEHLAALAFDLLEDE